MPAGADGDAVGPLGASPEAVDLAEDRERFSRLLWELGIPQTPSGTATSVEEAREVALKIGLR